MKFKLILGSILAILLSTSAPIFADTDDDYIQLSNDIRNNVAVKNLISKDPNKVQVLEFFSYGCGACARFESGFERWQSTINKNDVIIYRVPVTFNQDEWQSLANLYYVMRALDPDEKLNTKIFAAIHQQGIRLWEESAMRTFFLDNGYTQAEFDAAYSQYSNNKAAKNADAISDVYGINATPTVIVNGPTGSYLLTISQNNSDFFNVLNKVIQTAN